MPEKFEISSTKSRKNQRGGAGAKFLVVAVILFLIGHAAYNYVPIAYNAESFKQKMNETVMNAYAMPTVVTSQPEVVRERLRRMGNDSDVPADAYFKVDKAENGALKVQVYFKRQINILPFGLYRYNYEFNHVAVPNGLLVSK